MDEKTAWGYIIQQVPVVAFLAIVNWFQFKFFSKELEKKDVIIADLREEIKELNLRILSTTEKFIESTNRNTDVTNKNNDVVARNNEVIGHFTVMMESVMDRELKK